METNVNNKCKAFTSLEQSKLLAKILPLESADMCYIAHSELINIHEPFYKKLDKEDISCWSLAALLDMLSKTAHSIDEDGSVDLCDYKNIEWSLCLSNTSVGLFTANNPVDACVEMILELHELKLL
jgi:hypothetical protein